TFDSSATAGAPPAFLSSSESPPAARRALVAPLAPERFLIRFTASRATCEKLRRAQDLLRHAVPDGDIAEVFDRALTSLIDQLERAKFAARRAANEERAQVSKPGGGTAGPLSRHIPAAVKRAVRERDRDRCTFVASGGRRCDARAFLEFHHV